jgi:putative bacteriocin precursor
MKKLGKNLVNTKQTIEAYACSCNVLNCSCASNCGGNGTANTAVSSSKNASMDRTASSALSVYS